MSEARYGPLADRIARKYRIPPALFRALIRAESGWNPNAGSHAGARGLTQLMPATARGLGVRNITDPVQNMEGGARYLRAQLDRFKDIRLALAAYNAGPAAVQKYGGIPPYRETQAYVPRVLQYARQYGGRAEAGAPSSPASGPPGAPASPAPGGTRIDASRLFSLLRKAGQRALQGQDPGNDFAMQIHSLARALAQNPRATQAPGATMPGNSHGPQPSWSIGGSPYAGTHTLGDWQSDLAYDFMGKAGDPVRTPIGGRVTRISGQPGGNPRFAGYGVTIQTPRGALFFKHLGNTPLRVGQVVRPGALVGTLDGRVQGGPHLHLGTQNRGLLDFMRNYYMGRR